MENSTNETALVTDLPLGTSAGVCTSPSFSLSWQGSASSSLLFLIALGHMTHRGDASLFASPCTHHQAALLAEGVWNDQVVHYHLISFLLLQKIKFYEWMKNQESQRWKMLNGKSFLMGRKRTKFINFSTIIYQSGLKEKHRTFWENFSTFIFFKHILF